MNGHDRMETAEGAVICHALDGEMAEVSGVLSSFTNRELTALYQACLDVREQIRVELRARGLTDPW